MTKRNKVVCHVNMIIMVNMMAQANMIFVILGLSYFSSFFAVSLPFILIPIFSLLTGALAEHMGPRRLLTIAMFPVAGFWLMQAFAPCLWILYLGRALIGIGAAVVLTIVNPLLAELYPGRFRGLAGTFPKIVGCAGMLLSYLLAYCLSWDLATAVSAAPFLPLPFMLLLVPEV